MEKMSINDFCRKDRTYAQLIQDLFLHINVKELYTVLMMNTVYAGLEEKIPELENMTVGELLRYATEGCLSGGTMESLYDEESIQLGHQIIKALLVDLFRPYAEKNQSTYRSVLEKVKNCD